jgi:hypothetical protein
MNFLAAIRNWFVTPEPALEYEPTGAERYTSGPLTGLFLPSTMPLAAVREALEDLECKVNISARDVAWCLEAQAWLDGVDKLLEGPEVLPWEAEDGWRDPRLAWRESAEINQAAERRGL